MPTELALHACERYLAVVGVEAGDLRTHSAISAKWACQIAVRCHDQADGEVRRRALDLIDGLLEAGAYGATEAIQAYER